ncbi:N-acetylmannosamine-6-phosphate 2-epimerase [Weizmannia coagulans]|jgi:N-acylglucosamine-6-phosphate 2-epimerase|uniref:Putative N-acetylmannosamine-6-phosphate 2-epimerase n=2 Tax=Heyndrickxia TaxID=2837504 RepID=A0AAN0T4E5_HEYCO|nr:MULTISPECIES: N-acetylmannosamine-6-phosphate 2-epimerase [Heyndrickxia]AJO21565.1 N-acetylmannosamine-6-phosphate 2-epimerase [Heyndrickxia coagulans]AKN52817.1 N-acetylmannosamine-6-phosphate 2-epimerase [Heyndrickxia coagulans]ATW82109.1 putative N-acetylmannosamine-6-phosphate 2-epimerase [Heyndrickxia coagulans]KGB29440.1 N-acetylmannosamine-6-phosphate 2-epimerase [Heyndrickxia coagulans]KGT39586.1 N-acetylmannosamine-6-phosphate 2-epimerase [Heyndrickxia coagulans P38]
MFDMVKGKLIVSCQALEDEPLHSPFIMSKMALAAKEGGAAGIRANSAEDIRAIKAETGLPVIGIVKRDYEGSEVYITPTKKEIDELLAVKPDMIALDATGRKRPGGETLSGLIGYIHEAGLPVMADISTEEEGLQAARLGADCVSTTLSGYTSYSPKQGEPDFALLKKLVDALTIPVFAEGHIDTPAEAKKALEFGAFAVVVGSAITRPQLITKKFAEAMRS